MDNPKESHKAKIQKDKLYKNNYQSKAQKFTSKDWRVFDRQKELSQNENLSQEERNKLEQELKEVEQSVFKEYYINIANHNKYLNIQNYKDGKKQIWDYDFPLK